MRTCRFYHYKDKDFQIGKRDTIENGWGMMTVEPKKFGNGDKNAWPVECLLLEKVNGSKHDDGTGPYFLDVGI